jgi:hypothetical protein
MKPPIFSIPPYCCTELTAFPKKGYIEISGWEPEDEEK